ncbi:MAG: AAA family ATPase [Acidimicrobiales bacterium]|nr:AAA family ATPase [Acidimicrobiales bacterium]
MTGRRTIPLVGRSSQLAVASAALRSAAAGSGDVLSVSGEAGAGKTRLLRSVADQARDEGMAVVWATADPAEAGRPYAPLLAAFGVDAVHPDPTLARLAARAVPAVVGLVGPDSLAGAGRPGGPAVDASDAVVDLVERTATRLPLLLVVDDAQWADRGTLAVLRSLARRARSMALLLAVATRPEGEDRPDLVEVRASGPHLDLTPLRHDEVRSLATSLLGGPPGPHLSEQLAKAGGSPYLVVELLEAVVREGLLDEGPDGIDLRAAGDGAGETGPAVLRRLRSLAPGTLEVLRAAAVFGPSFTEAELAGLVGKDPTPLDEALAEAVAAGVLERRPPGLWFRHDLLHESLLGSVPAVLRGALHLDAARACAQAGAPAARVAHHALLAPVTEDRELAGWLRRAARDIAADDPATAARLLERAVATTPPHDPSRIEAAAELAQGLAVAGVLAEAERVATAGLAGDPAPDPARDLRRTLAYVRFARGEFAAAGRLLESGPEADGPSLVEAAFARLLQLDLDGAEAAARASLDRAGAPPGGASPDEITRTLALTALSYLAMLRGDTGGAVELSARAVAAADRSPNLEAHRFQPALFGALALTLHDRSTEAAASLATSRRLARRLGTGWDAPLRHAVAALEHHRSGRWDDCLAECETGLEVARGHDLHLADLLLHAHVALVAVRRGDRDTAEGALRGADDALGSGARLGLTWSSWARALARAGDGDDGLACDALVALEQLSVPFGLLVRLHPASPDLVRLALRAGRPEQAAATAEHATLLATRSGAPTVVAAALRCQALCRGDADAAVAAAEAYAGAGRPVEEADAATDAALALAAAGHPAAAEAWALRAAAAYEAVGADADLDRLRSAGLARRRGPNRSASSGPEALTPTERRVAGLVAEGHSNIDVAERLGLSRRTVETHLQHVFTKLGITNRMALALRWRERGQRRGQPAPLGRGR